MTTTTTTTTDALTRAYHLGQQNTPESHGELMKLVADAQQAREPGEGCPDHGLAFWTLDQIGAHCGRCGWDQLESPRYATPQPAPALTDEQIGARVRAVCHRDLGTKDGEYCLTVDELRALLTLSVNSRS